ncbi:hypothetical protein HDV05_004840 [Chytridiales sp. JEL 0842]|nr:hypothetical protein HDV05_004840 [Chytridiales sp. JEL 0842]
MDSSGNVPASVELLIEHTIDNKLQKSHEASQQRLTQLLSTSHAQLRAELAQHLTTTSTAAAAAANNNNHPSGKSLTEIWNTEWEPRLLQTLDLRFGTRCKDLEDRLRSCMERSEGVKDYMEHWKAEDGAKNGENYGRVEGRMAGLEGRVGSLEGRFEGWALKWEDGVERKWDVEKVARSKMESYVKRLEQRVENLEIRMEMQEKSRQKDTMELLEAVRKVHELLEKQREEQRWAIMQSADAVESAKAEFRAEVVKLREDTEKQMKRLTRPVVVY